MTGDPRMVVVTEENCNACGTPRVEVHHQSFPEMWISGESLDQAVDKLFTLLESNLSAVSDPMHRTPVQLAIADLQAFIDRDTVRQSKLSEVIDARAAVPESGPSSSSLVKTETRVVRRPTLPKGRAIRTHPPQHAYPGMPVNLRPEGASLSAAKTFPLVKETMFEAIRMVLPKDREISDHQVEGPITIYCLDGQIAFTARGQTHELRAGQWLFLLGDEPHSLRAIEDSSFLLTILFLRPNKERQAEATLSEPGYPNLPSSFLKSRHDPTRQ
jgi:quercetin dioxygenase-like cupin family protein